MKDFELYPEPLTYKSGMAFNTGFKEISEDSLITLLKKLMSFYRKIEYSVDTTQKLLLKNECTERFQELGVEIQARLDDPNVSFGSIHFYYDQIYKISGVIPLLKKAHEMMLDYEDEKSRRYCTCAYEGLKLLKSALTEFEEVLRLISALTTYPLEKWIMLRNNLVLNNFEEVAFSLEESESNIENNHYTDCIGKCRDAIEILIALIREQVTGEKTQKQFSTDLGKIGETGIFDEATQRLVQGVYSFLILKGYHKYDAKNVTVHDAESALKETYSLIEMLLRSSDYKKHD